MPYYLSLCLASPLIIFLLIQHRTPSEQPPHQEPSASSGGGCCSLLPTQKPWSNDFGLRALCPPPPPCSVALNPTHWSLCQHDETIPHSLFVCTAAQSCEKKGSHLTFCSGKGKILPKDISQSIKKRKFCFLQTLIFCFLQNLIWKHEEKFVVHRVFTCPSNNNCRWNCVQQWHCFLSISMRWKCLLIPIRHVSMLISWCVSRLYLSVWQICEMLYGNIWFILLEMLPNEKSNQSH